MAIEDAFFFTARPDSPNKQSLPFPLQTFKCVVVSDPILYLLQSQTKQRWVSKKVVQI